MTDLNRTAVSLVRDMKAAIAKADRELRQSDLKITKVELELRTVVERSGGGGITISVLEIGGDVTRDETNTLSLTLVPAKSSLQLMSSAPESLVAAILATAAASWEAADTPPAFDLTEATVTLDVGVTKAGKVQFFVHGSGSRANSHTMTITLQPLAAGE